MPPHSPPQLLTVLIQGKTPQLRPPIRADLPLWLALLLKRQRRADIAPPLWLNPTVLSSILDRETSNAETNGDLTHQPLHTANDSGVNSRLSGAPPSETPPFQPDSVASRGGQTLPSEEMNLPYHWLELSQLLLAHASDDIPESEVVRRLLRDLREIRAAKIRAKMEQLSAGAGVRMNGVGAMELGECRVFASGVVDNLRKINASREVGQREEWEESGGGLRQGTGQESENEDEDMM